MAASPPDLPPDVVSPDGLPIEAVYLGPLWGPGTLRYRLPPAASTSPGVLYLAAIDRAHEVVARANLAAVLAGGPAPGTSIRDDFNEDTAGNLARADRNWPALVEAKGK